MAWPNTERHFWSMVAVAGPSQCWNWRGKVNDAGYGVFSFRRELGRLAEEHRREKEAEAQRQADKEHRGRINREARAALIAAGLSETDAHTAIAAIVKGDVPHVLVRY